ncbi:MAG: T9SS type A sorting domain-containing protein, partial [Calditrichaeota bacterium]|nr:T9SS type A sorting domain-containing protein [Calditrichota bacterium]
LDDSIHFVVPGTDSVEVTIGAIDLCPVCKFTDISDTFLDTLFFINNSLNEDTASIILYGAFSTGIEAESSPEISSFELLQNYPNPFNPETKIQIFVKNADEYDLSVFDLMGRRITTLVSGRLLPGNYEYTWGGIDKNGFHVSSGHYFYRLQSHGSSVVKAMQLIR